MNQRDQHDFRTVTKRPSSQSTTNKAIYREGIEILTISKFNTTPKQELAIYNPAQNALTASNLTPFANGNTQLEIWTRSFERHEHLGYLMEQPVDSTQEVRDSQQEQTVLERNSFWEDLCSNISETGSDVPNLG